jgi:carboxyl-terminal processing protease
LESSPFDFHNFPVIVVFPVMKRFRSLFIRVGLLLAVAPWAPLSFAAEPDPGQVAISVGKLLEQGHFSRRKLDDDVSRQLLQHYLETLDYRKLYFTQEDVDALTAKYATTLDDDTMLGNPAPAVDIFNLYMKRVQERVAKAKQWIETEKFDFKSNRTIALNRQKAPWPKDTAEADQLWHDWIESEMLQLKLRKETDPVKKLVRRYDRALKLIEELNPIDVFLSCLAQTYDPHSEYMSKSETENFEIAMKLSLIGIGAQLQSDDGYAKVTNVIPGSPAQKDGRLKVGDRISGVAQGDADFVDVVDLKLDKVVAQIRGKKGTTVRLEVIPNAATDPSARKIIEIVRDEVPLKDQEAKAEIIERPDASGNIRRLGWITLPSFYADMGNNKAGAKSTTRDVRNLLERLKKENISGLVMDLRRNGGGSLDEAIDLTGLFIKKGPVVQVKNANGSLKTYADTDPSIVYDGPMIVLTNTLSASASEIFAAALQDYGRAVVVGDRHTFGKGTVQTPIGISRFIPFLSRSDSGAGTLKLTIQKFYRVAGGSTQLSGVSSDIVLPSVYDQDDIGEKALKGPLPYDEVTPEKYDKITDRPLFIDELRTRSTKRVTTDPEFKHVKENLALIQKKISDNAVSLNEKARRDEIAKEKARKEARIAERAKRKTVEDKTFAVTLDNYDKPELELAKNEIEKAAEEKEKRAAILDDEDDLDGLEGEVEPKVDPVRLETLNILSDLITLTHTNKTARVQP